ncbi:transcriptional regulator, CdaR family [Jatrophihabitans endophyticus]|uniref:Transcriptional regulator, CdaR family n=1 Tax=Jatrophihabitans endophyticus TaxID=1206085 RepID=A0A1M5T744_9ACTN|nr:helix-turn-helix domain-containing protein [Jatrophihabitans endophyticus]SHH46587.1 transcriptional regulator, CdaR family [Jatrophihabitans endophyticus]
MTVPDDVLAEVAAAGARDAGGLPVGLLGDFLETVSAAVVAGEQVSPTALRVYRGLGDRAARDGVALRALLDLYLSAAWRLWPHLPPVRDAARRPAGVVAAGEVMLHAADDVVAALAEGYQLARRALVRSQESARREFIDDLLTGTADVVSLLHRADGFGLDLAGPHAVATVAAERAFDDGIPLLTSLDRAIQGIKGDAHALLASKEGRLVVVFAAPDRAAIDHVVGRIGNTLDAQRDGRMSMGRWRIGLGRPGPGADAVVASYRESLDALELAERLGLPGRTIDARDLLVYQLLLRDRAALADLVESTLAGLRDARGGPGPLLDTLIAYFAAGGNTAACARELHLSVRAVTYRLQRVHGLTGLDVDRPADRFALHVAAFGARLLDWSTAST